VRVERAFRTPLTGFRSTPNGLEMSRLASAWILS